MKFIKSAIIALVLTASTVIHAAGIEETCQGFVEADVAVRHLLQISPDGLEIMLRSTDKEKNPKIKSIMRERIFWTSNRLDLPEDTFRRLSFLRCFIVMQ